MDKVFKSREEALEYLYSLPDNATDKNEDDDELEDAVRKKAFMTNNNIDLHYIPVIESKISPLTCQQSDIKRKQERSDERKKSTKNLKN